MTDQIVCKFIFKIYIGVIYYKNNIYVLKFYTLLYVCSFKDVDNNIFLTQKAIKFE